ncbi:MAG: hypothetical protein KGS45_08300 [Planctomycetes bacterium]|nr:hypothetical protein [Planctomycetota bacterium]
MTAPRLAAWLDPGQEDLCRAVVAAAGCELVSVGCSDRGRADLPAGALGVPAASDLRALLISEPVSHILILGTTDLGTDSSGQDVGALDAASSRGVSVVAAEPIPAAALEMAIAGWDQFELPPSRLIRVPSVLSVLREHFADVFAEFGVARAGRIEILTSPQEGGLASAVWSAAELLLEWFGEPESVDAAYADPVGKPGLKLLPGETLRGLRGTMTVNVRATSGRAVSIFVTDQAPVERAQMSLIGASGMLLCESDALGEHANWIPAGSAGQGVQSVHPAEHAEDGVVLPASTRWLVRALQAGLNDRPIVCRVETLLTITQAILLSSRTAQAESPETIARMVQSVRGG